MAYASKSEPQSALNWSNTLWRSAVRPALKIIHRACILLRHMASRSMSWESPFSGSVSACSPSTAFLSPSLSVAYSAIASGRMYVKLIRRRLTGRYGDGVSGDTGSAACTGLMSTKSAPVFCLASTSMVFRSS